jgi:Trk-type K+ transport system membrane component
VIGFTERLLFFVLIEKAKMEVDMDPNNLPDHDVPSRSLRTIGLFCALGLIVSCILMFGMNATEIAEYNEAASGVAAYSTAPVENPSPVALNAH